MRLDDQHQAACRARARLPLGEGVLIAFLAKDLESVMDEAFAQGYVDMMRAKNEGWTT